MKLLTELRSVQEESTDDTRHLDMLVRAGLANKAQLARIHKIIDRMTEDKPMFSVADRMIIQNLFNKMVDLLTNNPQIFQKARMAVREEVEIPSDAIPAEAENLEEGFQGDPPMVLILKRQSIRVYPDKTKVALYHNQRLDKYFTIPYSTGVVDKNTGRNDPGIGLSSESIEPESNIVEGVIKHIDGSASDVTVEVAESINKAYGALNENNRKKYHEMIFGSKDTFIKAVDFARKYVE